MKIHTAKRQSFLKTISFILAAAITFNILSMPALSGVSAESAGLFESSEGEGMTLLPELPDNADPEKMYIEQLFYGEGVSLFKDYGRTALDGIRLEIYEFLRGEIEKVAAGDTTDTVFDYDFSTPYTDEDVFANDMSEILDCLLADLPQDFYWYDKTETGGIKMSLRGYSETEFTGCKFSFTVSKDYAAEDSDNNKEKYKVNTAKMNSAKTAVENAQKIAAEYADMSDYEKIMGYKNRICNLTEYNHEAADDNNNTPYGDPWQLVYVFDDDPGTNVVCEGYAKAFQYLCDLGGIECYTVTGTMDGGTGAGGHMWNIVVLGGKGYLVDITNCDAGTVGNPDLLLLKGADTSDSNGCVFNLSNRVSYTYDPEMLSLYPSGILTVSCEDYDPDNPGTDPDPGPAPDPVHKNHAICAGAENCPDDIHGNHNAETWTEWDNENALPDQPGYYYLSANVTLTESWKPVDGISLCLNGHSVSAEKAKNGIILIDKGITFNLCDCAGGGSIGGNTVTGSYGGGVTDKGTFNMFSGKISGNTAAKGAVYVSSGTFNMYGGEISANNSTDGGGVYNYSSNCIFNMYGGKISGNTAKTSGGGIYSSSSKGVINIYGGTVSENTASSYGGGIYISGSGSIINLQSGMISENNASNNGGGVYINSSGIEINISGGKISGNTSVKDGGGIYSGKIKMTGGEISGNTAGGTAGGGIYGNGTITIGGTAVINDNNLNGSPDDLYLYSGKTITIDPDNPLKDGAYIGIKTYGMPKDSANVQFTQNSDADYSDYFHNNDPKLSIICDTNNALWLRLSPHEHTVCIGADKCPDDIHGTHVSLEWERWKTKTSLPTKAGNYFLDVDVTLSTKGWTPLDGVNLCLNGHTITPKNPDTGIGTGIIIVEEDKTFTLCDCQGTGSIGGNKITDENKVEGEYYGGGVTNSGTFNMYSGEISGNTSTQYGGVYNTGTFTIYGGKISENNSNGNTGGVHNARAFYMYGGEISGNTATRYGGVYNIGTFTIRGGKISGNTGKNGTGSVYNSGIFYMYGGEINENITPSASAAGVSNYGRFYMHDGKINENESGGSDGGVENFGTFDMYGGEISKNTASEHAGVCNSGGTFNMYGGKISENKAIDEAGGVCNLTSGSRFNMYGGEVSGNTAGTDGGGMYNSTSNTQFNMFGGIISGNTAGGEGGGIYCLHSQNMVGGSIVIKDNIGKDGCEDDLFLKDGTTIKMDKNNPLTDGADVGIRTHTRPDWGNKIVFTGTIDEEYIKYFRSSLPEATVEYENNVLLIRMPPHKHKVCVGTDEDDCSGHEVAEWQRWEGTDSLPTETGYWFLTKDVRLTESWKPADGVKLCLNGFDITPQNTRVGVGTGLIIIEEGVSFTLCDCYTTNGCVGVNTINDNNKTNDGTDYGGAITNKGTFEMFSGRIMSNISFFGGGICNYGTFAMHGGEINGNIGNNAGGGIYSIGNVIIDGKSYIHNNCCNLGGGIYSAGNTTIGGKFVIQNNYNGTFSSTQSNLYLPADKTITVANALSDGAYIGVTTEIKPDYDNPFVNITGSCNEDYSAFFYSDDPAYHIGNGSNNTVQLILDHDHSLNKIEAVEPTCTEPGNIEYYVCDKCYWVFEDEDGTIRLPDVPEDIEPLGHLYPEEWPNGWIITAEPTEEEDSIGEAERICERDPSHIERVELKTLIGEMWTKIEDIPATCTEEGKRVYTNEYGTVTVILKKLSHEYEEEWQKNEKEHWQVCKNCGTENPDSKNPHSWDEGVITVEPTTEHEGERTFTCEICGYTRTETIPKLDPPPETPPSETEPPETPPSETEPPETPPSETEPPETPPSETEPPETPPSETEPPETPPSETEPPETPPSETEPPETPPSETEPPETPPSETEPPETPPSETEPPETPPSETEPPETPPTETEPPVTPPSETEPPVTPSSETRPPINTGYSDLFEVPETTTTVREPVTSGTEAAIAPKPADTTVPPEEIKQGSISKRVESPDYAAELPDILPKLAYNVLTPWDMSMPDSGSVIEILLTVDKINTVSDADGAAVREALNGFKMWQYFDINLYKVIDGTRYKLSGTNSPVTIKIDIPEALRELNREYAMVRVHGGAADILSDLDGSEDTVTFATDKFSVYVLVYKDAEKEKEIVGDVHLNTGVDSYTSMFLATGITALSASMTFTVMGTGIMGMSEERKNKVYDKLIRWGKDGGKTRKTIALALIFLLLSYYYTLGAPAKEECKN